MFTVRWGASKTPPLLKAFHGLLFVTLCLAIVSCNKSTPSAPQGPSETKIDPAPGGESERTAVTPDDMAPLGASSFKLTLLKSWFAETAGCSMPVREFDYQSREFDFITEAKLIDQNDIDPSRQYGCFALQVEDNARWVPEGGSKGCEAGKLHETDLCPAGTIVTNVDGTKQTCTAGVDKVTLYFSTNNLYEPYKKTNPFSPPVMAGVTSIGLNLTAPIALSQSVVQQGYLTYDSRNTILASPESCTLEALPRAAFVPKRQ